MSPLQRIAIVGGGPAGSFAAAELAQAGREVLLFDEKLAWEKPCGGALTDKAIAHWPFLRDASVERNWTRDCELIAPSRRRVSFHLDRQIAIFSRLVLNDLMLERAPAAGAQVRHERILKIDGSVGNWNLQSASANYSSDFVVLAAGARNPFRNQFSQPLGPENFMVAVGYYIPGTGRTVKIKFLKELHGYIWIFPRTDHFSAGICGRMKGKNTAELRRLLEECLPEFNLGLEGARFYAHIIPSLTVTALQGVPFSGPGWAMIGDAAGFVDAITGEGLFYALRSAELLSHCVLQESPESYQALVRKDFLTELERASRIATRFYGGEWMGGAVIERMVQLTTLSARFRELMRDLFAGVQEYSGLKERLYRSLPRIVAEAFINTARQQPGEALLPKPSA